MGKKHRNRQKNRKAKVNVVQTTQQSYWQYGAGNKGCHSGPVKVFNVGTSEVYAGSAWETEMSEIPFDLLICMAGVRYEIKPNIYLSDTRGLLGATGDEINKRLNPTFLTLDVADGSSPNVGPRFWKSLVSDLRDKRLKVGVYCQGGHGRTGIVLACLAHFAGIVRPKNDAVKFIRSVYCDEAIEMTEQINYLRQMGITTSCEGSWKPATTVSRPLQANEIGATSQINLPVASTGTFGIDKDGYTIFIPNSSETTAIEARTTFKPNPIPKPDIIPASERQQTTDTGYYDRVPDTVASASELAAWEKEMIQEEQRSEQCHRGSAWDEYAG